MDIKKHGVIPCPMHEEWGFQRYCHPCLVETVVRLCEEVSDRPYLVDFDESAALGSLTEVFEGTHVAHFDTGSITNVTALPVTDEDLSEGIVRYTVEIRKD